MVDKSGHVKIIIANRRSQALSRPEFFHHLQREHWRLLNEQPRLLQKLKFYVQNHAVRFPEGRLPQAPFRIAAERDCIIELMFENVAEYEAFVIDDEYLAYIRPDEEKLADRPANITARSLVWHNYSFHRTGACKRFDFIKATKDGKGEDLISYLRAQSASLALDPYYSGYVDRHLDNFVSVDGAGIVCIRELWAHSFDALSSVAQLGVPDFPHSQESFSVFATEFIMQGKSLYLQEG